MKKNNRYKKFLILIIIATLSSSVFFLSSCKNIEDTILPNDDTTPANTILPGDPFYSPAPANTPFFDYSELTVAEIIFSDQRGTERKVSIALFEELAPVTCANFITLASSGHYNDTIIHRLVPDFVLQGGGYTTDFKENQQIEIIPQASVDSILGEFSSNGFLLNQGLYHETGVISMARLSNDKDSATDQFFICLSKSTSLDGEYAAFGKCIDELSLYNVVELGKSSYVNITTGMENCAYPFIYVKSINIIRND